MFDYGITKVLATRAPIVVDKSGEDGEQLLEHAPQLVPWSVPLSSKSENDGIQRKLSTHPTCLVPEYPPAVSRNRSQHIRPSSRMLGCWILFLVHQIRGGLAGYTTKEATTWSASTRPTMRVEKRVTSRPNRPRSTFYVTLYVRIAARRRAGATDDTTISNQNTNPF